MWMCFCSPNVQMVWESGCVVIVMLTPLSENGVKQCHHYWPDEGSDIYHIYEVCNNRHKVCVPEKTKLRILEAATLRNFPLD